MSLWLARMVVRVPGDTEARVRDISERLHAETRVEYSYSSIVRWVLQQAFRRVDAIGPHPKQMAKRFTFANSCRSRLPGARWSPVVDLDLIKDDDDFDIEFEESLRPGIVPRGRKPYKK